MQIVVWVSIEVNNHIWVVMYLHRVGHILELIIVDVDMKQTDVVGVHEHRLEVVLRVCIEKVGYRAEHAFVFVREVEGV